MLISYSNFMFLLLLCNAEILSEIHSQHKYISNVWTNLKLKILTELIAFAQIQLFELNCLQPSTLDCAQNSINPPKNTRNVPECSWKWLFKQPNENHQPRIDSKGEVKGIGEKVSAGYCRCMVYRSVIMENWTSDWSKCSPIYCYYMGIVSINCVIDCEMIFFWAKFSLWIYWFRYTVFCSITIYPTFCMEFCHWSNHEFFE